MAEVEKGFAIEPGAEGEAPRRSDRAKERRRRWLKSSSPFASDGRGAMEDASLSE